MKTVYCPVINDNIDGVDCYIICDVAEGYVKPTLLPKAIMWNDEQCTKCKKCQYHNDISGEINQNFQVKVNEHKT